MFPTAVRRDRSLDFSNAHAAYQTTASLIPGALPEPQVSAIVSKIDSSDAWRSLGSNKDNGWYMGRF